MHIRNAAIVVTLNWLATWILYFVAPNMGVWRYLPVEILTLWYFYSRWAAPDVQHRALHFIMMICFLFGALHYFFQLAVNSLTTSAFMLSPWWNQLLGNVLFAGQLVLIAVYGVLLKRAKQNKAKWKNDVDGWFAGK